MSALTKDLCAPALDWVVAQILRVPVSIQLTEAGPRLLRTDTGELWRPSSNWAQGGPLLDAENMSFDRPLRLGGSALHRFEDWRAVHPKNYGGLIRYHGTGPTLLVAALRCFVSSRLGDAVLFPDELAPPDRAC